MEVRNVADFTPLSGSASLLLVKYSEGCFLVETAQCSERQSLIIQRVHDFFLGASDMLLNSFIRFSISVFVRPSASGDCHFCITTPSQDQTFSCLGFVACESARCLIIARAASASTANTLNLLILLQLLPRHAADACAVEVCLLGLNAAQAAELSRK